jgi:hypothetical protein
MWTFATSARPFSWVRYAKQKHDHVDRWAVGEEVWGNGGIPGINQYAGSDPSPHPAALGHSLPA